MTGASEVEAIERPPSTLRQRGLAGPDRAPELIALAASERFAEPARRWAAHMAASGHPPEEIARIAVRRHTRLARAEGAVIGLGGAVTSAADLVALTWIQSRLVFFVAAAYGYDPAHPDRARPSCSRCTSSTRPRPRRARPWTGSAGRWPARWPAGPSTAGGSRPCSAGRLRFVGRKAVKRVANRAIPFLASPIAAVQTGT